jgi:hypothetical protein
MNVSGRASLSPGSYRKCARVLQTSTCTRTRPLVIVATSGRTYFSAACPFGRSSELGIARGKWLYQASSLLTMNPCLTRPSLSAAVPSLTIAEIAGPFVWLPPLAADRSQSVVCPVTVGERASGLVALTLPALFAGVLTSSGASRLCRLATGIQPARGGRSPEQLHRRLGPVTPAGGIAPGPPVVTRGGRRPLRSPCGCEPSSSGWSHQTTAHPPFLKTLPRSREPSGVSIHPRNGAGDVVALWL